MTSRLKLLVGLILFAGLVIVVDPDEIAGTLVRLDGDTALAVTALGIAALAVQFVKWRILCRWRHPGIQEAQCFESLMVGFGLGCLLPGRLGELGRGLFLPGRRLDWFGLAAVDRLGSSMVTIAAAAWGFAMLRPGVATMSLALAGAAFALLYMVGRKWLGLFVRRWERTRSLVDLVVELPRPVWMQNLAWSVIFNVLFFYQFWLLLRGFGVAQGPTVWAIPCVFALKALLPVSLLDMGIREAASVVVLGSIGVEKEIAFASAFILFVVNVLVPGVAGVILTLHRLGAAPKPHTEA